MKNCTYPSYRGRKQRNLSNLSWTKGTSYQNSKVIYLLKAHVRWETAKTAYKKSKYDTQPVSNDEFAKHLLENHQKSCSHCVNPQNFATVSSVDEAVHSADGNSTLQHLLNLNQMVQSRLQQIESRFRKLNHAYSSLLNKVSILSTLVQNKAPKLIDTDSGEGNEFGSSLAIIRLNKESDFPDGSWLGDVSKTLEKVRCHISPTDLFHINSNCHTVEKMALMLLDYLFDRGTQAESNISGQGRNGKKQLNPLYVYGIQCHLRQRFGLDAKTWNRIKVNLDSKCRSAYRRKCKGLPLGPKSQNAGNSVTGSDSEQSGFDLVENQEPGYTVEEVEMEEENSVNNTLMTQAQVIQTEQGEIQIIRATPEALAQLKNLQQFQIVTDEHLLSVIENQQSGNNKD